MILGGFVRAIAFSLTELGVHHVFRVASISSLPVEDMSSGPRAPDMELAFSSLTDAGHGKKPSPKTQGVASVCICSRWHSDAPN